MIDFTSTYSRARVSALLLALACGAPAMATTFNYVVPNGVTTLTIDARGARGGSAFPTVSRGGNGGRVTGTISVTSGQVLQINVGGMGGNSSTSAAGSAGYNGGGSGGLYSGSYGGGGGGGATDIRISPYALADRIAVAGGGGGGAYNSSTTDYDRGGFGNGPAGEAGYSNGVSATGAGGYGATQSAGGGGGFWSGYCTGTTGSFGAGGNAGSCSNSGGGGGGGYYGGGGGVWAGGGGGSSYLAGGNYTGNFQTGSGKVVITSVAPIAAATATLNATSSATESGYFVVVAQGSAAPTATQVIAQGTTGGTGSYVNGATTVNVVASGNNAMTANAAVTFALSGLSPSTAYAVYFAANDSTSALSGPIAFTTVNNTTATTITNSVPISTVYGSGVNVSVNVVRTGDSALPPGGTVSCVLQPQPSGAQTVLPAVNVSNGSATCAVPTTQTAGGYKVTASYTHDATNDPTPLFGDSISAAATLTINPAALTITANALSKTYGQADPTLTYTSAGLVNGDTIGGSLARAAGENAGAYAINQGTLTAGGNYAISYTGANFTINKAALTITANALSKAYGQADPPLTYTSAGLVNGDMLSGSLARAAGETAGTYAINQGTLTAGGNYAISYTGANFTINKAALTITADALSKTYGQADPALTYTSAGLVNGDTISGSLARAAGENAGAYAINQGTLTASGNYAISYTGANFTIDKAALTITADNQSRAYGTADPTFTWTPSGFVNGDMTAVLSGAPTLSSSDTPTSAVGTTYPITITQGTLAAANYTFNFVNGTLTIGSKASQTITFGAAPSVTVNGSGTVTASTTATPAASYPITFSTSSADCTVTSAGVVTGDNAGTNNCIITATQAGDANYNPATATQMLSIGKKSTTIALTATPNPVVPGGTVTITATVAGDPPTGTVTFCDNAATTNATCTGGTLLCTVALVPGAVNSTAACAQAFATQGTHNLSAFYAGDANFTATTTAQAEVVPLAVVAPAVPAPALSQWLLGLLGGLLAMIGLARMCARA